MLTRRQRIVLLVSLVLVGLAGTLPHKAAPAPQISDVQVTRVRSGNSTSWETISTNQLLTNVNHGGNWLEVETKEIGYSNPYLRIAKFAGTKMTELSNRPIVAPGGVITGYYRVWRHSKSFTSGQFTYEATSINPPYTKKSDWVNVK